MNSLSFFAVLNKRSQTPPPSLFQELNPHPLPPEFRKWKCMNACLAYSKSSLTIVCSLLLLWQSKSRSNRVSIQQDRKWKIKFAIRLAVCNLLCFDDIPLCIPYVLPVTVSKLKVSRNGLKSIASPPEKWSKTSANLVAFRMNIGISCPTAIELNRGLKCRLILRQTISEITNNFRMKVKFEYPVSTSITFRCH